MINEAIKSVVEDAITRQFNKMYDVKFNGTIIKVAPISSQIPKVSVIRTNEDSDLIILFAEDFFKNLDKEKDYENLEIFRNDKNEVVGFAIGNIDCIKENSYRKKLNHSLVKNIHEISEKKEESSLRNHIEKRIIYAIRDVIRKMGQNDFQNFSPPVT